MSNRFKPKRNKALRQQAAQEALRASGTLGNDPGLNAIIGESREVKMPNDEKVLLKTVRATVQDDEGVVHVVGKAHLYDDRSVDYIIDEDAPQWAKDKIRATEKEFLAWQKANRTAKEN